MFVFAVSEGEIPLSSDLMSTNYGDAVMAESDPIDLDDVVDTVTKAIEDDNESIKQSEKIVEEQIEEDIELAHEAEEEERRQAKEDIEQSEEDEKDLESVSESLEYYRSVAMDKVGCKLALQLLNTYVYRHGIAIPDGALESAEQDDLSELIEFVNQQREKVAEKKTLSVQERNARRLKAWKAISRATKRIYQAMKSNVAEVGDLTDLENMKLRWVSLDDSNRKEYEVLSNTTGKHVHNVIDTLSMVKDSVLAMNDVITQELEYYDLLREHPEDTPSYGYFIGGIKKGPFLFKEPLLGAFNLRIDPVAGDDENAVTYSISVNGDVGELTDSQTVRSVSEEAMGDHRELELLKELSVSILRIAYIASKGFVRLYESDSLQDAPNVSIRLVTRLLRILVALRRNLSLGSV